MSLKQILQGFRQKGHVAPYLDRYLLGQQESGFGDGFLHPSSLSGGCTKALFYSLAKAPSKKAIPPKVQRIFDNGHYMHRRYQEWLYRAGLTVPVTVAGKQSLEVPVGDPKLRIRGSTDGLIKINRHIIIELKSINSAQFYGLTGPKKEHVVQGNLYMWCRPMWFDVKTGKWNVIQVPEWPKEVIFYYENKDTQEVKEYSVTWDPTLFAPTLELIKYVNERFDKRILPAKGVHCDTPGEDLECSFRETCALGQQWVDTNVGKCKTPKMKLKLT